MIKIKSVDGSDYHVPQENIVFVVDGRAVRLVHVLGGPSILTEDTVEQISSQMVKPAPQQLVWAPPWAMSQGGGTWP